MNVESNKLQIDKQKKDRNSNTNDEIIAIIKVMPAI